MPQALFGHLGKGPTQQNSSQGAGYKKIAFVVNKGQTRVYFLTPPEVLLRDVLPPGVLFPHEKIIQI